MLLLAARVAAAILYSGHEPVSIPIFPDLASMYAHFITAEKEEEEQVVASSFDHNHPQALLDSLLALTVLSLGQDPGETTSFAAADETQFQNFVISLTSCTARQSYVTIRRIPGIIVHKHPSPTARFNIIHRILDDDNLQTLKESAIGWLKEEILSAHQQQQQQQNVEEKSSSSIFLNPKSFSTLFPLLFNPADVTMDVSDILASFTHFVQITSPQIHSSLSLYYILISSNLSREKLQIPKTYQYFRTRFLEPLRAVCHGFVADLKQNGGPGRLEDTLGEEFVHSAMMMSVDLINGLLERIEDVVGDAFVVDIDQLEESSV